MKKFKKLVATALVAVMVLTTMALSASAGIVFWHGNEQTLLCKHNTGHDNQTDWCADHLAGKKRKHSVWGQDRKSRS